MKTSKMAFGFAASVCAATLAFAAPTHAADSASIRSVLDGDAQVVTYGDLDLSTQSGAQRLLQRVKRAAESACDLDDAAFGVGPSRGEIKCQEETTARAVAQIGSPMVSSEYAKQTHSGASVFAERR
jgi:UrcA family protein